MPQFITTLLASLAVIVPVALKFGIVVGALGTLLEAIGVWRNWPKFVAFGQKLEAIGADIPKLIGKLPQAEDPPGPGQFSSRRLPRDPKPPSVPPFAACLALVLAASGCAFFESKLPDAEKCLPTPASLAAQVADILAAGEDFAATKTALEQLAITQGEQAVICAVKAFLSSPRKVGAGEADAVERVRARAYLATKGVK